MTSLDIKQFFYYFLGFIVSLFVLFYSHSYASQLVWNLDYEYTGAYSPSGNTPWVTVKIDDSEIYDSVVFEISTSFANNEFLKSIFFNTDSKTLGQCIILYPSTAPKPLIMFDHDGYHAAGDGWFDLRFDYDRYPDTFSNGEVSYIRIVDPSLNIKSFDLTSVGGPTQLYCAAHIGGIGENGEYSGWITTSPVPEPGTFILLLFSCMNFFACKFFHRRKK